MEWNLGHLVSVYLVLTRISVHTLQAIGLLIGMEDVPLEKQTEYLSALLTPLCQQVNFNYYIE